MVSPTPRTISRWRNNVYNVRFWPPVSSNKDYKCLPHNNDRPLFPVLEFEASEFFQPKECLLDGPESPIGGPHHNLPCMTSDHVERGNSLDNDSYCSSCTLCNIRAGYHWLHLNIRICGFENAPLTWYQFGRAWFAPKHHQRTILIPEVVHLPSIPSFQRPDKIPR